MGIINLLLVPLAVIFAFTALLSKTKYKVLFVLVSEACCAILPITAIVDINERMAVNDYGGIEDIYPTMIWIYIAVFIFVTILNEKNFKLTKKISRVYQKQRVFICT